MIQSMQAYCTGTSQQQIINAIKGKTIDTTNIPTATTAPTTPVSTWYKGTSGTISGVTYYDTTDPTYNYIIGIGLSPSPCSNPVVDCSCIVVVTTDKSSIALTSEVPVSVMNNALNTLPFAGTTPGCGTGVWNGCTAGIQNKYLIVSGGVLGALLLMSM